MSSYYNASFRWTKYSHIWTLDMVSLKSFVISKVIAFMKPIPPFQITTQRAQYIKNTRGNGNRRLTRITQSIGL